MLAARKGEIILADGQLSLEFVLQHGFIFKLTAQLFRKNLFLGNLLLENLKNG